MYGKTLVVVAHPDDDVLGAGAIIPVVAEAYEVKTIYLSNGVGSREGTEEGEVEKRLDAMEKANEILGVQSWEVGLFEDQRFDQYPIIELTKWVEQFVRDFKPDTVLTHSPADLNRDHRCTFEAAWTACRPVPGSGVKYIYSFEVPSATEWGLDTFKPNVYLMGKFDVKAKAMEAYGSEIPASPHPRSIAVMWNRACTRGSECGMIVAEAFELQRMVL